MARRKTVLQKWDMYYKASIEFHFLRDLQCWILFSTTLASYFRELWIELIDKQQKETIEAYSTLIKLSIIKEFWRLKINK